MLQYEFKRHVEKAYGLIHNEHGLFILDIVTPHVFRGTSEPILPGRLFVVAFKVAKISACTTKAIWSVTDKPTDKHTFLFSIGARKKYIVAEYPALTFSYDFTPDTLYSTNGCLMYTDKVDVTGLIDVEPPTLTEVWRGPGGGLITKPDVTHVASQSFTPSTIAMVADAMRNRGDTMCTRMCKDGRLYSVGFVGQEASLISYDRSVASDHGVIAVPRNTTIRDFDVSPSGRRLALAYCDKHEMVTTTLAFYSMSETGITCEVEYVVPADYIAFSPDGLTVTALGTRHGTYGHNVLTTIDTE